VTTRRYIPAGTTLQSPLWQLQISHITDVSNLRANWCRVPIFRIPVLTLPNQKHYSVAWSRHTLNSLSSQSRKNLIKTSKSYSRNRSSRPLGLWVVKDPTLSIQPAHRRLQGCQPYAPAALYFAKHYYFSVYGTHFCWRLNEPQGLVRPEGLGKLKTAHLIGSRTRDLPKCSIVP
jgi:hypothetical protein